MIDFKEKARKEKRTSRMIMKNIQKLIGINPNNFEESLKYYQITKPDLLKLEFHIKETIKRCSQKHKGVNNE